MPDFSDENVSTILRPGGKCSGVAPEARLAGLGGHLHYSIEYSCEGSASAVCDGRNLIANTRFEIRDEKTFEIN